MSLESIEDLPDPNITNVEVRQVLDEDLHMHEPAKKPSRDLRNRERANSKKVSRRRAKKKVSKAARKRNRR